MNLSTETVCGPGFSRFRKKIYYRVNRLLQDSVSHSGKSVWKSHSCLRIEANVFSGALKVRVKLTLYYFPDTVGNIDKVRSFLKRQKKKTFGTKNSKNQLKQKQIS